MALSKARLALSPQPIENALRAARELAGPLHLHAQRLERLGVLLQHLTDYLWLGPASTQFAHDLAP